MYGRTSTTRSPTRTRSSSARTSSSADRARPACSSYARAADQPGAGRARRRHGRLRQPASSTATSTTRCSARRAARRRSSSRSAPAWSSSSRRRSAIDVIRAHEEDYLQRRGRGVAGRAGASRSSATSTPSGSRSCRSWSARPSGRYLHHNFVVALLNDLFGIQSRGGCSLRRPVRPPAARHRPRPVARVRARDHRAAARASSPAGCASTSTTSSPRRSSTTSSRRSAWSPRDGWRLLRRLPLRRRATGLWRHRDGPVEPPLRPAAVTYDADGEMRYPRPRRHARPRVVLARATSTRRGAARARPRRPSVDGAPAAVSADFEHLRWFELPAACVR